jgi:hypothetical protein
MGYYGQYTGKFIAAALAFSSTYASFGVELGAQDEMDQDKVLDYLKSVSSIEEYFGTIDFDKGEYGYPTDSPVPNDIRKTVADDIKPNAGAAGYELEVELKKWHGIATPQQALVLETIRYLGLAFQQAVLNLPGELREINKRLTSITEGAVQFIKDGSKCFTQVAVLGDYADWYEVISAQDLCTGEEITTAGRVISAVGIIGLSGKFWRAMGQSAGIAVSTKRVFKDSEAVVDYAKKWDGVESLLHVVKGNYQIAADGTRKLVSGMHTKLGFDNFLKLNQNAGKAYSIRNVTEFTAERIEAGGEILSQTLDNGVRRIQLPRDAWANNSAFSGANFPVSDSLRLKGVKTLWPDSYDIQKIGDITTRIVEANPSIRNDVIKATVDGLTVNVRVDPAGKVLTSFPAWNQ